MEATALRDTIMKMTSHYFCHIVLIRRNPHVPPTLLGKGLYKDMNTRGKNNYGTLPSFTEK